MLCVSYSPPSKRARSVPFRSLDRKKGMPPRTATQADGVTCPTNGRADWLTD